VGLRGRNPAIHRPLFLLIHAFRQAVCVKLVVFCDVTLCNLVEGGRYLQSYRSKTVLRNVEVLFTEYMSHLPW